uniref:Uncharacterized protein n=1 Tax=Cliftonaea pectinata TaxID=2007206 RepID=A0A1Z1MPZ1_9FLOR|nr:hypothetical protein [Cliftonaea pectinata]ARW68167.1 hypothetical protein [Cliftonaea pectinata]
MSTRSAPAKKQLHKFIGLIEETQIGKLHIDFTYFTTLGLAIILSNWLQII